MAKKVFKNNLFFGTIYIVVNMKKIYLLIIIFIVFIVSITLIGSSIVIGNNRIKKEKDIFLVQSNKEVYFDCYGYSLDNPNIIINPYGNSPLTAIVMFESSDYSEVSITIKSKDGNSDINYTFKKDKYHFIPIYGLYPDYDNTVVIESEGQKKILNIKTDKLPDDFKRVNDEVNDNFVFYNDNYPYAIDNNGDVRWFLNKKYYGKITLLDNSELLIGSDKYVNESETVSLYRMNLLGKIYNEFLLSESYYGYSTIYKDNLLILSDELYLIDIQTGDLIKKYKNKDSFDYLDVVDNKIIVGKDNKFYNITNKKNKEISYSVGLNKYSFYNNTVNYKIIKGNKLGSLNETKMSNKNISLFKYKNKNNDKISINYDQDRITVINETEKDVYIILDKFMDKRVYKVGYVKYINNTSLNGIYTIYYMIDNKVYKTDYSIEV